MATTADYLNKLVTQKNTLADNLVTKGVEATHDETFETLVTKVLEISGGGGGNGIYPIDENGRPTGDVVIPSGVKSLHQYVFRESTVTNVVLPEGLTSIGQYAFFNCNKLENSTFPSTLSSIGDYAFSSISNLTSINIPDSIGNLTVGNYAFNNAKINNTTANKITSKTTSMGDYAFYNMPNITDITTYTASGSYCFSRCIGLKNVIILHPNSKGSFGGYAFKDCTNLVSAILPDDATSLSVNMFENTKLKTITLPNGIIAINSDAFLNCKELTDVTVSENSSFTLGSFAFGNCVSLSDNSVTNLLNHTNSASNYVFSNCTSLQNITTKMLGDNMFNSCTGLVSCVITDITKMPHNVFNNCTALKTVVLPSTITSATYDSLTTTSGSYYAFNNCTALEDIQLGQDWNMSLRLNVSNNLTHDSMVAMFNSLKDLTGDTAKTLTLGSTNLAKLTDEEKAIATNKNWTLA